MKLWILSFLVLIMFFLGCSKNQDRNQPMNIGVSKVDIAKAGTNDPDDPVYAKAIVFRQGKKQVALVIVDLIGLNGQPYDDALKLIEQKCGIPAGNICLSATHTHSNPEAPADLAEKIATAVIQAQAQVKPTKLFMGKGYRDDLSFNRRFLMRDGTVMMNPGELNPDIVRPVGPIDPEIGIISFRNAENSRPYASLTSFAVHCCTTSGMNKPEDRKADYPYWLEQSLCAEYGQDFISVFGEATCEDLNHFDVNRPNHNRNVIRGQFMLTDYVPRKTTATPTPNDPKYIGESLADEIKKQMSGLKEDIPDLGVRKEVIEVPLGMYSDMDMEWVKNTDEKSVTWLTQFRIKRIKLLEKLRSKYGENIPVTIQVFRLGKETAVVALPGQVFVEFGLAIKKASPFANTMVIELANERDYIAIIPLRKSYCEGHFEIIDSVIECGGGEMMTDAAIRLLKELKNE